MLGMINGWGQHLAQGFGTIGLQQFYIAIDNTGHSKGKMRLVAWTCGNLGQATSSEGFHGRCLRCHPLPTQRLHRPTGRMVEHPHALGREGIRCRGLKHCRRKAHRHCCVEGIPTAEEHAHAGH